MAGNVQETQSLPAFQYPEPKTPPALSAFSVVSDRRTKRTPITITSGALVTENVDEEQTHAKMAKTLANEVQSGIVIDVPQLVEDKLTDEAISRGMGKFKFGKEGSRAAKRFSVQVSGMMDKLKLGSILGKGKGWYSPSEKRWRPWRTSKKAEPEKPASSPKPELASLRIPEFKKRTTATTEAAETADGTQATAPVEAKPEPVLSDEEQTADFFNAIGENIRNEYGINGQTDDARVFSARFRNSAPADAAINCVRKPDCVVLERSAAMAPDAAWRDVKGLIEIKRADTLVVKREAYRELLSCARMVFAAQINRRFILGATLCGDTVTFYVFDRSGVLCSAEFDINKHPNRFVRVVCGLLFADEIRMGFDPTIIRNAEGQIIITMKETEFVCDEDPLYIEKSVRGRGTGCFRTVHGGEPAVIKDAWVDDSRKRLEHEILEKVKDVEGVVKIVDHEIVQVEEEDDSTAKDRHRLIEDEHWKTEPKWKGFAMVETRTHRRIIMKPCGEPLESFANLRELLLAIKDIIKTIEDLIVRRVLHRDISLRNLILARSDPDDPNSRLRGYLIDFDYALDLDNLSEDVAKGARTGTLPFMALEMLVDETTNKVHHAYYHDLESVFYSLCWLCMAQEGPNNTERTDGFDFNTSEVAKWNGVGMENPSLDDIRRCKAATIRDDAEFIDKVLDQFAPYFEPIKPCVLALRDVMVNEGANFDNPLSRSRVEVRKAALEILRQAGGSVDPMMLKGIPNSERDPRDVFDTLYDLIDGALAKLVEPPIPVACTPEGKAKERAEEEARQERKRMKFKKYRTVREVQEEREAVHIDKMCEYDDTKAQLKAKKQKQIDEVNARFAEEYGAASGGAAGTGEIPTFGLGPRTLYENDRESTPALTADTSGSFASGQHGGGSHSFGGQPISMESTGSKRRYDGEEDESTNEQPQPKRSKKLFLPERMRTRSQTKPTSSGSFVVPPLPSSISGQAKASFREPDEPASRSISGQWSQAPPPVGSFQSKASFIVPSTPGSSVIPSSMESTHSKRSFAETEDSVESPPTSDSRKRLRSGRD